MVQSSSPVPAKQEVRWFVWTIVFLVVVGVSLVSYIVFSDSSNNVTGDIVTHSRVDDQKNPPKAPVKK